MDVGLAFESTWGLVPEYEEREAAVYTLHPWSEWVDLHSDDRATAVAHYRAHLLIEAHVSDAVERASERQRRRAEATR